jgi:hypothetical protein
MMKKISAIIFTGLMMLGTSCKKYFDINKNPNDASSGNLTPELLLPGALVTTAGNLNSYNTYGAQIGGYMANAGGYGGFGVSITYNYTSSDWNGLWSTAYDNLGDYQAVLNRTEGDVLYGYFNAAARIMKALNFQLLVDTYNNVPYTQALKGDTVLSPAYDDAKTIYKDLASELDKAIATINATAAMVGVKELGTSDVLFKGNVTKWKQLANTIKLRLILHAGATVTFANTTFSSDGFLTTDALINPVYVRDNGKQNPKWGTWGFSYTGASGNKAWMPTTFIMAFYNGVKLTDPGRGAAIYYQFPATPTNQLGNESVGVVSSPEGSFWYPNSNRTGVSAGNTTGVLKGPETGVPLITAAESYFLQAEAVVKGLSGVSGTAATLFNNGIAASFKYLYTLPDDKTFWGDPVADAADYLTDNTGNPLVDFSQATTTALKTEAIITQKYIALNMVNSDQAWNDYRRTQYPKLVNTAGATATQTFASKVSESSRPDRLPTRILYPSSEGSYNATNVPKGISPFSSTIFWAL